MTVQKCYDILLNCISMEKTPLSAWKFHKMYENILKNSPLRRKKGRFIQKITFGFSESFGAEAPAISCGE